jgi:hypothetical protein
LLILSTASGIRVILASQDELENLPFPSIFWGVDEELVLIFLLMTERFFFSVKSFASGLLKFCSKFYDYLFRCFTFL